MAKPEVTRVQNPVVPTPSVKPTPTIYPPARRVRVERSANNSYVVVEDTYEGAPKRSKVLARGVTRNEAEYEVRFWLESFLGDNRFGESGL